MGRNPAVLQSGRQDESFYQTMWASLHEQGHWQGEIWNRRKNGEVYPQLLTISTVRDADGQPKNYVGVMTDISQLKKSEADLERLAHYDPLTNLPNRLLTHSRLEHALVQARREGTRVAVLFLDLDRFKNVNDSLGHPTGDCLLKALTKRLASRLRDEDSFGRLGGDEFTVILTNLTRDIDVARVARKVIDAISSPFQFGGQEIFTSTSIGISVFPNDGWEVEGLVKNADMAMYAAKEKDGNGYRFFTEEMNRKALFRMKMESSLRKAMDRNELLLYYQPLVNEANHIVGMEALLRWHHPELGLILPGDFIRITEETVIKNDLVLDRNRGSGASEWGDTLTGYRFSIATYF